MKKRLIALLMCATFAASSACGVYADETAADSTDTETTTEATTKEETTTEATTKEVTTEATTKETTTEATTAATTKEAVTEATTKAATVTTSSNKVKESYSVTIDKGESYKLATKISSKISAGDLDWNTSDKSIVTVETNGRINGKKKGSTTVTGSGTVDGIYYEYNFTVKVTNGDDDYDKSITISVGDKKNLYSYVDKSIDADDYDWTSKSKSIATVSDDGYVKGVKKGTATITAEYKDNKYTFEVKVKNDDDDDSSSRKSSSSSSKSSSSKSSSKVSTKTTWTFYMDEDDRLDLSQFMDEDPDDCTWDVEDDDVIDLNEKTGKIEALEEGDCDIEAEGDDDDYTFKIKVDRDYSQKTLSIKADESKKLESLLPEDIDEYSISSDRTAVAKVSGKTVVGVANGVATIICKHDDGDVVQIIVTVSGSATTTKKETTTEATTSAPVTKSQPKTQATTAAAVNFADISSRAWAVPAINAMASKGFIVGRNSRTFAPDDTCTRADFTIVLVKLLGLNLTQAGNYDDVKSGSYYYSYVSTAMICGIESGVKDNKFRPTDSITREEIMVMVYKGMLAKGIQMNVDTGCLGRFTDSNTLADENRVAVASLVNMGAVSGDSDTTLSPKKNITRAQMAVLLNNVYNTLQK